MTKPSSSLSRRNFLVSAGAIAGAAGLGSRFAWAANPPTIGKMDPGGHFGSLLSRAEFDAAPQALKPQLLASLTTTHPSLRATLTQAKPRHILSNLPPVSQQGTPASLGYPGTCEAQSFGYCLGTYTAANGPIGGFDPTPAANRISAAWLFAWLTNQEGKMGCGGSMALDYLDLLVQGGAPSELQVPYKPDCASVSAKTASNPNGVDIKLADYAGISKFRLGSLYALPNFLNGKAAFLELFKHHLLTGHAIAFSGLVPNDLSDPSKAMTKGAFNPKQFIAGSGHGQVIVGFDDGLGPSGAFLIQNSFGTDWPYLPNPTPLMAGRLFWTYESFFASQGYGAIAFPYIPHVSTNGVIMVAHPAEPGDPEAVIKEVATTQDAATGEHVLILQHSFSRPVRLLSVSVSGPGRGAPITTRFGRTISNGHSHVRQATAFTPGVHQVTVQVETFPYGMRGRALTYTANLQVR